MPVAVAAHQASRSSAIRAGVVYLWSRRLVRRSQSRDAIDPPIRVSLQPRSVSGTQPHTGGAPQPQATAAEFIWPCHAPHVPSVSSAAEPDAMLIHVTHSTTISFVAVRRPARLVQSAIRF